MKTTQNVIKFSIDLLKYHNNKDQESCAMLQKNLTGKQLHW